MLHELTKVWKCIMSYFENAARIMRNMHVIPCFFSTNSKLTFSSKFVFANSYHPGYPILIRVLSLLEPILLFHHPKDLQIAVVRESLLQTLFCIQLGDGGGADGTAPIKWSTTYASPSSIDSILKFNALMRSHNTTSKSTCNTRRPNFSITSPSPSFTASTFIGMAQVVQTPTKIRLSFHPCCFLLVSGCEQRSPLPEPRVSKLEQSLIKSLEIKHAASYENQLNF